MNKSTTLFLFFLLTVSIACKALTAPMATATPPKPTATPRPSATWTPPATPTSTPTVMPTESPVGEFQFGEVLALDFLRSDWRQEASALVSLQHPGCAVVASGGADFPGALTLPETEIGGYMWLNAQGSYLLKIGEQVSGAIHVDYGEKPTACRKAAEMLLKSLHAVRAYAEAGVCNNAPKQQLKVGESAAVRVSSYLRKEPRWAEEMRVRLLASGTVKITGWLAEGDLNAYYLLPKE